MHSCIAVVVVVVVAAATAAAAIIVVEYAGHAIGGMVGSKCRLIRSWFRVLFFDFAIDEKVVQDPTRAPDHTVCPSLDA